MAITTRIDPFTTSPNRSRPSTFSADMDTRLGEENSRIQQMNAMSDEMDATATLINQDVQTANQAATTAVQKADIATTKANEASQSASNAASSASSATQSASNASSSATTAIQKANEATTKANEAKDYRDEAEQLAGAMANNLIDDNTARTTTLYSSQKTEDLLQVKSNVNHNHDTRYLGVEATAKDSQKLGNIEASEYQLKSQTSNKNYIINGGLQIWQRGAHFNFDTPGQQGYTADRFLVAFEGDEIGEIDWGGMYTLETGELPTLKVTFKKNATSGSFNIRQYLEVDTVKNLRGKTLTLSFYARASKNIKTMTVVFNNYAPYNNNIYTVTTNWQRFNCQIFIDPNVPIEQFMHLQIIRIVNASDFTLDDWLEITGIKLEIGDVATPFVLEDYTTELQRCKRYFQKFSNLIHVNPWDRNDGGRWCHRDIVFPVEMRTIPTIKLGTIHNASTGTKAGAMSTKGFYINGDSIDTGGFKVGGFEASAE